MKNKLHKLLVDRTRQVAVMIALLVSSGFMVLEVPSAGAAPSGYQFESLLSLGDPAPGGSTFTADFEPYGINNRGDLTFAGDLSAAGQGVFLVGKGAVTAIARSGQPAPGGGVFGAFAQGSVFGIWGDTALNEVGDVAFGFGLAPLTLPFGLNSGLYHYSHTDQTLRGVVVPGVTPAPGGGTFQGTFLRTSLNNRSDIAFAGIILTDQGIHREGEPYIGQGMGIFLADRSGAISSVVSPGDSAPGGGTFDFAENPWINDAGDIAFGAHVAGEECIGAGPQATRIFCSESVYVKKAATGQIVSIAHQGEPAPGGGNYRLAFGPILNNRGDLVFMADLTPPPDIGVLGVFLHTGGATVPVARPGDPMPGGGHFVTGSGNIGNDYLNNAGDVTFNGRLDTDDNGDGIGDTGLWVWSGGSTRLVARTGSILPGVGTIAHLNVAPFDRANRVRSGAAINDRGVVFFQATLTDGRGVLLVATPQ